MATHAKGKVSKMTTTDSKAFVRFQGDKQRFQRRKRISKKPRQLPTLTLRPPSPHHMYIPKLQREITEQIYPTPLSTALTTFTQSHLGEELESLARATAQIELRALLDKVFPTVARNLIGLDFLRPIIQDSFVHWQLCPEKRIVCFLPVRIPDVTAYPQTFGTFFINLPPSFDEESNLDYLDFQNEDFVHHRYLSSKKLYAIVLKFLGKALLRKSIPQERMHFSSSQRLLEITLTEAKGWIAEVVPCVVLKDSSSVLCSRNFIVSDQSNFEELLSESENSTPELTTVPAVDARDDIVIPDGADDDRNTFQPEFVGASQPRHASQPEEQDTTPFVKTRKKDSTDITWYVCFPRRENSLIQSISMTDSGIRMSAMLTLCRLCQRDWRLKVLTPYQIQTAMLYDADHHLDHTPRWQRNSLERCTKAMLSKLHHFAKIRKLTHFFVQGVNLWEGMSSKKLSLVLGALDRLTSSDIALTSLVCRAGGFTLPPDVQIYSSFLSPRGPEDLARFDGRVTNHFKHEDNCTHPNPDRFERTNQLSSLAEGKHAANGLIQTKNPLKPTEHFNSSNTNHSKTKIIKEHNNSSTKGTATSSVLTVRQSWHSVF